MRGSIASNAETLRELKHLINDTFRRKPHGPEHHAACEQFHSQYDSLAFPGGLEAGLECLKHPDTRIIEATIQFLEVDPQFFRSGYIKETLLRRLKHCDLTDDQQSRVAKLIIRSMDHGGRREFQGYSRLARRMHPSILLSAIGERVQSHNPEQARRARAVQHALDSNRIPSSS